MRRIALVLALMALALPARALAAPPPVPADWIGVAADGPLTADLAGRDGEWDRMRADRVGFVRTAFYWRSLQPTPDVTDLTSTDAVVLAAARRGLGILPVVSGSPVWAAQDPGDIASPPKGTGAYAVLLQALVDRYGPAGTLWADHPEVPARPVRTWQVWNEPNITAYWSRQPFARGYVALLRAARAALRRADPGATVLLAGLPNRSWTALRSIYRAGGKGAFDAIALHPYTSRVSHIVDIVRLARKEARRAGDGRRPIWLTELSWPASRAHTKARPGGFEVSEAGQARRLGQTFRALARVRRSLRIAHLVWYTWLSAEGRSTPTWSGYTGLRRVRGGRTVDAPSLAVFKRTVGRLRR